MEVYDPIVKPNQLKCYGLGMTSKYPPNNNSVFLQRVKNNYFFQTGKFESLTDQCEKAAVWGMVKLGATVTAFFLFCGGLMWRVYQNPDFRREVVDVVGQSLRFRLWPGSNPNAGAQIEQKEESKVSLISQAGSEGRLRSPTTHETSNFS